MSVQFLARIAAVVGTACLLGGSANGGDGMDYQKVADGAQWGWSESEAGPFYCMGQLPEKYGVRIATLPGERSRFTFAVTRDSRDLYTWRGHRWSIFRVSDDQLFYADWNPNASGGDIVAVDLRTAKELWRSSLQALGPVEHSAYANHLNLTMNSEVITILGNEGAGRYIEFKSVETGKTVGHKIFPKDAGGEKK